MDQQTYIIIGISIFTFLVGIRLKKRFSKKEIKPTQHVGKQFGNKYKAKIAKSDIVDAQKNKNKIRKAKWRALFLKIVVLFMFVLIMFMIPAITQSLMVSDFSLDENIILRILILCFAIMCLISGVNKILKKNKTI